MPLTPSQIAQQEVLAAKEGYVHRTLVGFDQFANVVLGGDPDETISSRSQRAAQRGDLLGKAMCWWLDKLESDHGQKAQAADIERAVVVEKIEEKSLGQS